MYDEGKIREAAIAFGLVNVTGIKVLSAGLMHKTFKLDTIAGTFILQQLHPLLSSEETVRDFMQVTEHLHHKGFFAPLSLRTGRGEVMYHDLRNAYRVYTYVPGQTVETAANAERVREAGAIVGRFHMAMCDFELPFESTLVLHDTPAILDALARNLEKHKTDAFMTDEVREVGAFIVEALPKLLLPESLPKRPSHGDLKITNLLFNEEGKAVSLIDFDTCNRMMLPVEMGDAFRSWCGAEEDNPNNAFALERFKAGWEGYVSSGVPINPEERRHIVQGILLITLELAARFLNDYFDDSYFGWDKTRYASRREHNLARAKGQLALYRSLEAQRAEAEAIVNG